jgi:hypothetical protein
MPKRDESYMNRQREMLTAAALDCFLQKGLPETSMRDIAKRAYVSLGTLYVHFSDKNELVLAACRYSNVRSPVKPCKTWSEYILRGRVAKAKIRTDAGRSSIRLSHQIAAELTMKKKKPPEYFETYAETLNIIRTQLRILHQNGEISLPLGLEQTVLVHMLLANGLSLTSLWVRDAASRALFRSYEDLLALTAGYQRAARVLVSDSRSARDYPTSLCGS